MKPSLTPSLRTESTAINIDEIRSLDSLIEELQRLKEQGFYLEFGYLKLDKEVMETEEEFVQRMQNHSKFLKSQIALKEKKIGESKDLIARMEQGISEHLAAAVKVDAVLGGA